MNTLGLICTSAFIVFFLPFSGGLSISSFELILPLFLLLYTIFKTNNFSFRISSGCCYVVLLLFVLSISSPLPRLGMRLLVFCFLSLFLCSIRKHQLLKFFIFVHKHSTSVFLCLLFLSVCNFYLGTDLWMSLLQSIKFLPTVQDNIVSSSWYNRESGILLHSPIVQLSLNGFSFTTA